MIFNIGTVCVKLAGRDAGKQCVIVDFIDDTFVLIDGQTRRRKCNVMHLEPTGKKLDVKKGADSSVVKQAFKSIGVEILESKPKKAIARPKKTHKKHEKIAKSKKK